MSVENNNTAETASLHSVPTDDIITVHTTLGEEDEDVHRCGRCQSEFTSLEAFIRHKLQNICHRGQDEQKVAESTIAAEEMEEIAASPEKLDRLTNKEPVKSVSVSFMRRRRRSSVARAYTVEQPEFTNIAVKLNEEGRYLCDICNKTFKTANILRTHLGTHSEEKNFQCKLCCTSFRTKGSLIRHNRRHTDERPYRCTLCGLSFRESGALTRHLKSITPCTEKIRFNQCKEVLINKEGVQKELREEQPVPQKDEHVPVDDVVESCETIQEVQVQDQAEVIQVSVGDSLISQAIINSGIALGTGEPDQSPKPAAQHPDSDSRLTEIQVTEECVEMETGDEPQSPQLVPDTDSETQDNTRGHRCFHCNRIFKTLSYLKTHVKGHLGFKPFKCSVCQKEFLTGYLLKKHMEAHLSERRFRCGECGKLYKTIGHVREHMRAHSEDRPYHCNRCDKGYKTKNALQVHQRTHGPEKPYVCQFCSRGFREKGSLVRHLRHHTGEKPFKCFKCGRGFAEHGTLNRHIRAKGGCSGGLKESAQTVVLEEQTSADNMAATLITDDPHAVLVEFSSVVADTQEYIIQAPPEVTEEGDEVHDRSEVGSHIMKVVQQIVNQSNTGHQIIVQNVSVDDGATISADCGDTITIATPESLTEQVAMTLASAIGDGAILAADGQVGMQDGAVTMVASQEIEVMEQSDEFVITSPEELEIQTVIV